MQKPQEMWAQSLGLGDPLEEGMAAHATILAWRIPWTEEPGGLQSIGSQRVRDQFANIHCIIEKAREFQKKHLLLLY